MSEKHIQLVIKILMLVGLLLIVAGLGLIIFTKYNNDTNCVLLRSSLIAAVLLILLPTKLYLVFQSLKKKDNEKKFG